jgi:DNA-binding transcriptional MerR regulator
MGTEKTSYSLDELSQESGIDTRVIRSFIENGLLRGPSTLGRYARYSQQHLDRLIAIKVMKEKQSLRLTEVRQQLLAMSDVEIAALAETGVPDKKSLPKDSALDYIRAQCDKFLISEAEPVPPSQDSSSPDDDAFFDEDRIDAIFSAIDPCPTVDREDESSTTESKAPPTLAEMIKQKMGFARRKSEDGSKAEEQTRKSEGSSSSFSENDRSVQSVTLSPIDRVIDGLQQVAGERSVRRQSKKETWHRIPITPDIELTVRGMNEEQLARLERVADYLRDLLTGGSYE